MTEVRFAHRGRLAMAVVAVVAAALWTAPAGADDGPSCLADPVGFGVRVGDDATLIVIESVRRVDRSGTRLLPKTGVVGSIIDGVDLGGGRGLAYTNEDELVTVDGRGMRRHPFRGVIIDIDRGALLGLTEKDYEEDGSGRLAVRFLTALNRPIALPGPPIDFANLGFDSFEIAADARAAWVQIGRTLHRVPRHGRITSLTVGNEEATVYPDGRGGAWYVTRGGTVRVIGADGKQRRRLELKGDQGVVDDTIVVAGSRLHVLQSRPFRGRDAVELVTVDDDGRLVRVADRRGAPTSSPHIVGRVGSRPALGWLEGRDYYVGTLDRPVRVPGILTGLFQRGLRTLVMSIEDGGTYARVLTDGRLGRPVRVGPQCLF